MLKMRYGGFVWPNNPRTYTLTAKRQTAVYKVPEGGFVVQDLGRTAAVMQGEGEFYGSGAYETFRALLAVFQKGGCAALAHPVWSTAGAYFTELQLTQEPRDDYVAYRFTFCEAPSSDTSSILPDERKALLTAGKRYLQMAAGQTLWSICAEYGLTMTELLRLNPQIAKPSQVQAGEQVRVQ